MEYKLIALDMDGTLLNSKKEISTGNIEAINKALKMGKHVVLSSGRAISEISEYMEQLNNLEYAILESGALVYDFVNKRFISKHLIDRDIMRQIFDKTKNEDAMFHMFVDGQSFSEKAKIETMEHYGMGVYKPMFKRKCCSVDNIYEYFENKVKSGAEKFNIYCKTDKDRDVIKERLRNLPLVMADAEGQGVELSPLNVTKGLGLKELCEHLNISIEETICVGDADNDLDILKTAGLAVAMENANQNAKEVSDVVVSDNDNDGVKEAIEKYLI